MAPDPPFLDSGAIAAHDYTRRTVGPMRHVIKVPSLALCPVGMNIHPRRTVDTIKLAVAVPSRAPAAVGANLNMSRALGAMQLAVAQPLLDPRAGRIDFYAIGGVWCCGHRTSSLPTCFPRGA
jgi:hypothetical protein